MPNSIIELDPGIRQKALQAITDLQCQTQFLAELIQSNACRQDNARTHMSLLRGQYDDLAQCLGTDVLSKELEDAFASCRRANARISELEKAAGGTMPATNACACLRAAEERLSSWYALCGFQYAKLEWSQFGIRAEFSSDIEKPDTDRIESHTGDRALKAAIAHLVPYAFDGKWDRREDSFHDELLDTAANRENIMALIKGSFPDARVIRFTSRLDRKDYLLRFEANFPWESIDRWHGAILEKAQAQPSYCGGEWFARLAALEHRLASRDYKKYASPEQIKADKKEHEELGSITQCWKNLITYALEDRTEDCREAVAFELLGTVKRFRPGSSYRGIETWLADEAACDVSKELAGCKARPWDMAETER